jgi:hypothetical protein
MEESGGCRKHECRLKNVQVPQPAALFHNDCQHLARELLTLPYQYSPLLQQLAPSAAAHFIKAAQRLRAAGAAVLDAQVGALLLPDFLPDYLISYPTTSRHLVASCWTKCTLGCFCQGWSSHSG